MRKILGTTLGILAVAFGVSVVASAQDWIRVPGRIQAVDCQTNALTLNAADGTHVFPMAPNAQIFLNTFPASLCSLHPFAGGYVIALVTAIGNQMVAARVDVFTAAAAPSVPSAYYPCCGYYPYYGSFFEIGISFGFGPGFYHR